MEIFSSLPIVQVQVRTAYLCSNRVHIFLEDIEEKTPQAGLTNSSSRVNDSVSIVYLWHGSGGNPSVFRGGKYIGLVLGAISIRGEAFEAFSPILLARRLAR